MVSYFWPPFLSATQRAAVHSIMCSYNAVSLDGEPEVPSCAWGWANNEVVRGQWGWEGFFVSDCGAISGIIDGHHYVNTSVAATAAGILGGTDVNCGSFYGTYIADAVSAGLLTLADLAQAGTRLLTVAFSTGLFDPADACAYNTYGPEMVDTPAHRQLALEGAIQGGVLLKNDVTKTPWGTAPLLPLQGQNLKGKTVAVIGPNANSTGLLSIYIGSNTLVNSQTVLQGLQRRAAVDGFTVTYSQGCDWLCNDTSAFQAAVQTAAAADVVVLAVGLYPGRLPDGLQQEDEGYDRLNLTLPGFQSQLVSAVVSGGGKPVVLLLIHGGPLALDPVSLALPTILDAHYPGEMGGDAVTALLFGDASPSGRLTTTIYPAEYVNQRNMTDYTLAAHTDAYGQQIPGVTYLYYSGPAQWPFGFGLSYTTFSYTWLSDSEMGHRVVDVSAIAAGALPPYAVNITNTGSVTSDVSALAFLSTGVPGEPLQQLFDFQRAAAVAPGQTVTLEFTLPPESAAVVTADGSRVLVPGTKLSIRIGDVPRTPADAVPGMFVTGTVEVTGQQAVVLSALPPRK